MRPHSLNDDLVFDKTNAIAANKFIDRGLLEQFEIIIENKQHLLGAWYEYPGH